MNLRTLYLTVVTCFFYVPFWASAESDPIANDEMGETALQAVKNIVAGWNIGNTLEATEGEGSWGNPCASRRLIDGVRSAGFNAVRIPCSWHTHLLDDAEPYTIDPAWLERVKEVIDYAYDAGMYVVINTHWDGGWLEQHANEDDCDRVVKKEKAIWTQIANAYAGYGQRLIFAGNNEIRNNVGDHDNWGTPSPGERKALEAYNQAFVDAVRSTGGNNAVRNLAVQSWCCNPILALEELTLPHDPADSHLMVEVHFYEPMDYTHTTDERLYWGERRGFTADSDYQESYIDELFGRLRARFVDQGYGVILGEYGTKCHSKDKADLMQCDRYYLEYVTKAAKDNGLAPFYWDNGFHAVGAFGVFDRYTGEVVACHLHDGIMAGARSGQYPF